MAKEKVFESVKSCLIQSGRGLQINLDIGRHEDSPVLAYEKSWNWNDPDKATTASSNLLF